MPDLPRFEVPRRGMPARAASPTSAWRRWRSPFPPSSSGRCACHPERVAVSDPASTLSYRDLNRLANRIAHGVLAMRGAGSEPVAILAGPASRSWRPCWGC